MTQSAIQTRNDNKLKYNQTYRGRLIRMYNEMRRRSRLPTKPYIKSENLVDKQKFLTWALKNEAYRQVYNAWVRSGYDPRLTPTPDRIDAMKGYLLDNIRFMARSENIAKGNREKVRVPAKAIELIYKNKIERLKNAIEAAKRLNVARSTVRVYIHRNKPLRGYQLRYVEGGVQNDSNK